MRTRGAVVTALILFLFLVPTAQAAHASWHADWDADGEGIEAGVSVGNGGGSSGGSGGTGYTYVWTQDACTPDGSAYVGDSVWVIVVSSDGQIVGEFCADPDGNPPPAPPTADEVLRQAPLPRCEIRVNPREKGLTGVETWLWCEELGDVTVTAGIRGYSVTAKASPQEFRWKVGDGASYVSSRPGTEKDPSAKHMYDTKGKYVIEVDVAWSGSFSYRGHGVSQSGELGGISVDSDRDYRVIEARGVLEQ